VTTTTSLAQKIQQAINSGTQPSIAIDDLLAQQPQFTGTLYTVDVDVASLAAGLPTVYRIAALLPGLPIGQWLPQQDFLDPIFANGVVNLTNVAFTVDTTDKTLYRIALALTLGPNGSGLTLQGDILSAAVKTLTVTFYPGVPSLTVITIGGSLTINQKITLDAALSCPSLAFACTIPSGSVIPFADLVAAFDLPCPDALKPLQLKQLDLDFTVRDRSAYLQTIIDTSDGSPLPIVKNLALDSLTMELSHAPGATDLVIGARLTLFTNIVMGVIVSGGTGQDWRISGYMDVPATAANLGKDTVSLADIISTVLDVKLPGALDFLSTFTIDVLDGTVVLGKPITWWLEIGIGVDWTLGDATFTADTTVEIASDGSELTGTVSSIMRIGEDDGPGLELTVTYECTGEDNKTLIIDAPQLKAEFSYDLGTGVMTTTFDGRSLGELIGQVAGIFTGNPYVTLPSPWSDVLNAIPLPKTTITVYLKDTDDGKGGTIKAKTVNIEYEIDQDFFGNQIKSFVLGYDPSKPSGKRLTFQVKGDFPLLPQKYQKDPAWDPTKPGEAPAVPGQGAKLIDIQLIAAGQRVKVDFPDDATVETAVAAIAKIATDAGGSDPDKLPVFDPTRGWLVATHMVIKGALDFQFVFADPLIYGAVITVAKQDDTPAALAALDGLYAEILYRKVSDSIGVYQGTLTLPDKIRLINYGAFMLQLPSISVDVYTNGDFLIDVGFPHNGDFSRSAVINAGQYIGAGGVYYGHLSGATASALPPVPMNGKAPYGVFNTVTEIGIGLRVGIGKSYSQGPLSASISVTIQAIFEGVFSNYTQLQPYLHPDLPVDADYYRIVASLGIVGQLQGKIDFAIITASLLVEIKLIATVTAEAYKAVQVEASVSVDVELTVSINLGLFSIDIHCSFSTTVSLQARFGSDQIAPWSPPAHAMLMAARPMLGAAAAALTLDFEQPPCQNVAIPLYVVPQLSRGLAAAQQPTPSGTPAWAYMLQFALPIDASGTQGTFADFAKFITAWTVDAAWRHAGSPTNLDQFYASLQIDLTQTYDQDLDRMMSPVDYLVDALKAIPNDPPAGFDASLQAFFAQNQLTLTIPPLTKPGADARYGFFPLVPGLALSGKGGEITRVTGVDSGAVRASVLRAYAVMVATSVLDAIVKSGATGTMTLKDAYAASSFSVNGAVGMATRYMLHGTRYGADLIPLYRAVGQELGQIDLGAAALIVTIAQSSAGWGVSVQDGQLTLSSTDASGAVQPPSKISSYATAVTSTGVSAYAMPSTVQAPLQFSVKQGPPNAAPTLRALPSALQAFTQQAVPDNTPQFDLYYKPQPNSDWSKVDTGQWAWCSTINFRIQRVPDPANPGKFLGSVYALVSVRSDGMERLQQVYKASTSTLAFTTLEIVYGVDANQTTGGSSPPAPTFVPVDPGAQPPKVFLFQGNISTETNPPRLDALMAVRLDAAAPPAIDPKLVFLGRLLTGGLTNSGGYYLYLDLGGASLPPAMFDTRGMAWLTLAVSGFTSAGRKMQSYFSALRLKAQDQAGAVELALRSESLTAAQATMAPGFVGVEIKRPDWKPSDPKDPTYQGSLDGLFNLIDCEPASFVPGNRKWTVNPGAGHVVGPIRLSTQASSDTTHYYRAQFDLLAAIGQKPDTFPSPPTDDADPYQFVGAALTLGYGWIDFYGNTLPASFKADNLPIQLVDPLHGLDDWPSLSYGFAVTGGPSAPMLTVSMTFIPQMKGDDVDESYRQSIYPQYVKIFHQLRTTTVTATATFVKDTLAIPDGQTPAATVLRNNILTLLAIKDKSGLDPNGRTKTLGSLSFPLPTPIDRTHYDDTLLYPLTASLVFNRAGQVVSGMETRGDNPILVARTALAPFQAAAAKLAANAKATDAPPIGYGPFATDLETTLAPLGFRVMGGDLDVPGGAQFWLLRWQAQGLQVSLEQGGSGFAPKPIATALQSRSGIARDMYDDYPFPKSYLDKVTWPLNAVSMDMDAVLSSALTAIESFLSPQYAIPAAISEREQVDTCIANKQALAEALAGRVVQLSGAASDDDAAKTKYQQACLLDLRNYYAVDAAASLTLSVDTPQPPPPQPPRQLPRLIVYGHFDIPQRSNVTVSAGQSLIDAPQSAKLPLTPQMGLSLSARHKDWQASFPLPDTFYVEALQRVDGEIAILDPDEPGGKARKYVTGTWLRFITDSGRDLALAAPPTIPLPLRSYPPMPTLSAQGFSELSGKDLVSVKAWSLDCTYHHQFAAQDTMHVTAVLNQAPTPRLLGAERDLDLLDVLTLFQAVYPFISETFDTSLRLPGGQPPLPPDTVDAIKTLVLLVQCIGDKIDYQPDAANIGQAPPGNAFKLTEFFATETDPNPDPATTKWQATITRIPGSDGVLRTDAPIPVVVIDETPAGQAPGDATMYKSTVQPDGNYQFLNGNGQPLMAVDAIGNPDRKLEIGPLDIVDWHNGRYYLQTYRNENLPIDQNQAAFVYVTGVVAAKDRVLPFISHTDETIDLMQAGLPVLKYGSGGPTPNSFGDILARLYYALLTGTAAKPQQPPGGMRTEVALTYPLIPGAPADASLPNVRVPIALQLVPTPPFTFYPTADQAWAMAKDLAANVTTWLKDNVGTTLRPDLYTHAGLDMTITMFSNASETSLPMIYLDGLYVACKALAS
jgi:hypothetical protein